MLVKQIRVAFLIIGVAIVLAFAVYPPPGSHLPGKVHTAELQILAMQQYASHHRDELVEVGNLNNYEFVRITGLAGTFFKFDKGEVLDPWGQPYLVSWKDGQIIVASPGLERYNKFSSFHKEWINLFPNEDGP